MKPCKNIYTQICDFENLYEAYRKAALGKRFRSDALAFADALEANLHDIRAELLTENYRVGRYREFYIYEPKKRLIMALPFRDRVVQWAVYRVVNPLIARGYIDDSYACIDGRGLHQAVQRLQYWAQFATRGGTGAHYLKLDISKYYYRIDHDVLLDILRRRFDDKPLMRLFETIVRADIPFGLPEGANPGEAARVFGKGMPIGNLTSQMFANLYLNELDQFVKRELRVKHYCRYMDDMIVLGKDKAQLHELKTQMQLFLTERLELTLNDKTVIRPLGQGIDFCGYRVWPTHIKLRKSSALRVKHRLKKLMKDYAAGETSCEDAQRTLAAYKGVLAHCGYALRKAIYGNWDDDGERGGWFYLQRDSEQRRIKQQGDGE